MATKSYSNLDKPVQLVEIVRDNGDGTGAATSPAGKTQYTLLSNATATGSQVGPIDGGDYIWRAEASNWNGATATLQFRGLDGTSWFNVRNAANTADVTLTANGQVGVGVGQGSLLRVAISGAVPAGVYSNLSGL